MALVHFTATLGGPLSPVTSPDSPLGLVPSFSGRMVRYCHCDWPETSVRTRSSASFNDRSGIFVSLAIITFTFPLLFSLACLVCCFKIVILWIYLLSIFPLGPLFRFSSLLHKFILICDPPLFHPYHIQKSNCYRHGPRSFGTREPLARCRVQSCNARKVCPVSGWLCCSSWQGLSCSEGRCGRVLQALGQQAR